MKKNLLIALFFFPVSFLSAQLAGPRIQANISQYDFGEIMEGIVVKFSFQVKNAGDQVLHITNIMTSCGCTAAAMQNDEIQAGEGTSINVEFNSEGKSGPQHRIVTLASNDPSNPSLKLEITGKVLSKDKNGEPSQVATPKLQFEKTLHDFGKIKEGSIVDYTFKYKNVGSAPLEISHVRTSCGCTAAVISGKSLKPKEEGTLKVEFDSSNREGVVTRTITLTSNDPLEPQKILTIMAFIEKTKD
ncbi:MAG: DUF1573 domain-containing protein [Ignavibacteriaceae bacterium]|nr:DUF1573 domain-containing protein [Ignavibacteriaceae bacterium]